MPEAGEPGMAWERGRKIQNARMWALEGKVGNGGTSSSKKNDMSSGMEAEKKGEEEEEEVLVVLTVLLRIWICFRTIFG